MKKVIFALCILFVIQSEAQTNIKNPFSFFKGYKVDTIELNISKKADFGKSFWKNVPVPKDLVVAAFQTTPPSLQSLSCGDFNNDGFVDVYSGGGSYAGNKSVSTFLIWNDKTKLYDNVNLYNNLKDSIFGGNKRNVTPIYLNKDNYVDFVIFDNGDEGLDPSIQPNEPIRLILSDGKGKYGVFAIQTNENEPMQNINHKHGGDVDDLNGDGLPDLLITCQNVVYIYWGINEFPFFKQDQRAKFMADGIGENGFGEKTYHCSDAYNGVIFDVNKDGLKDILYGMSEDTLHIPFPTNSKVLINQGGGRFNDNGVINLPVNSINLLGTDDLFVDDINGDGKNDIISLTEEINSSGLNWNINTYLQKSDGSFRLDTNYIKYTINTRYPRYGKAKQQLFYTDINGDGKKDIGYFESANNPGTFDHKTIFIRNGDHFVEGDYYLYDNFAKTIYKYLNYSPINDFCKFITKPLFIPTLIQSNYGYGICKGDSSKINIDNILTGETFKWFYGSKSDTGILNYKFFKDTATLFILKTDSLGCQISSDTIKINYNFSPNAPPLVSDISYCQNATAILLNATPFSQYGISWWGMDSVGGNVLNSSPIPDTKVAGQYKYYVSQYNILTNPGNNLQIIGKGCEGPRTYITVKINPAPDSPSVKDTAYCNNISADTLKATSLTGHTLNWYGTSATGGTASILGSKPATTTVGSFSYYVSQKNNTTGCEGARAKIGVTINPLPVAPIVSDTNYCNNASSDTLRFNTSTGATLLWYGTNATGGTGSSTAIKPSTATVGTANYYLSQIITATGCEGPRSKVVVTTNALPTLPTVKDTVFCQNISSSTLLATGTSGNTITWYGANVTGGTGSTSAVVASTTDTTTKSYYVSQISNTTSCESPRVKITVKINPAPVTPSVKDTAYCNNINADTLKAASLTGHTLNWYGTTATGGTASILGSKPTTTTVGSFSYYVSQKNNSTGCEGARAKIGVIINPLPIAPIVRDTNYCNNASADTIRLNASTGATFLWYGTNATGGTSSTTAIKPSTATVGAANYYLSQIITATGCEGPRSKVVVTTKPIPTAPSLSRDTANFLLSGAPGTTWYKDGNAITDTAQKYKPATPGSYTAKTTTNGCTSVMSAAYYYLVTDIINLSKDEFIKLAPNPFVNQLNFDFIVKGYQRLNLEVFDIASGTKVASQQNIIAGTQIQLSQLVRGTYIIRVTSNDNKIVNQFKMVKM